MRCSGMMTNSPVPVAAGVVATVPATRTRSGPIPDWEVSSPTPEPMIAAADGDASTVVTPAEEPSLASGAGGYGTLAV